MWFSLRLGVSGYRFLWLICPRGCNYSKRQEGLEVCEGSLPPVLYLHFHHYQRSHLPVVKPLLRWFASFTSLLDGRSPKIFALSFSKDSPQGSHLRRRVSHGSKTPCSWHHKFFCDMDSHSLCLVQRGRTAQLIRSTHFYVKQTYFQSLPQPHVTSKLQFPNL